MTYLCLICACVVCCRQRAADEMRIIDWSSDVCSSDLQRQTGGQGLFRADDNLESPYAKAALRQFYQALRAGRIACCSLATFTEHTGLDLTDQDGSLKEDLPPITRFLNRLLALSIGLQDADMTSVV